jgi:hypothetical protein
LGKISWGRDDFREAAEVVYKLGLTHNLLLCIYWLRWTQSQVEGNFVKDGQSSFGRRGAGAGRILGYQSDSHEKTIAKGALLQKFTCYIAAVHLEEVSGTDHCIFQMVDVLVSPGGWRGG